MFAFEKSAHLLQMVGDQAIAAADQATSAAFSEATTMAGRL
jgi:hypothetical protein